MHTRYHNFWRRLGASIIDGLVISPVTTPAVLVIGYGPAWLAYLAVAILVPLPWAYTTYCHGRWGQTLGKHVTEIRVVRADTLARIGYVQALRRDAGTVFFGALGAAFFLYAVRSGETEAYRLFDRPDPIVYAPGEEPTPGQFLRDSFEAAFPSWSQFVVTALNSLWGIAEVITMLTNPRRRALHDYIGGTVVIHDPQPRLGSSALPAPTLVPEEVERLMFPPVPGPAPKPPKSPGGTGW